MESQMSQDSDSGQVETTEAMDDTSGAQATRPSEQTNVALTGYEPSQRIAPRPMQGHKCKEIFNGDPNQWPDYRAAMTFCWLASVQIGISWISLSLNQDKILKIKYDWGHQQWKGPGEHNAWTLIYGM